MDELKLASEVCCKFRTARTAKATAAVVMSQQFLYPARPGRRGKRVRVTAARFQGVVHNFVTLNSLAKTAAARGAMALAIAWLREGFAERR